MDASDVLAQIYGQDGQKTAAEQESLQKQAQVEYFLKLAEENKVDLTKLSEDQVEQMFQATMKAADPAPAETKTAQDQLIDAAQQEYLQKQAEQEKLAEKVAEAEVMGRVMARSLVDELEKMSAAKTQDKTAAMPPAFLAHLKGKDGDKDGDKDDKGKKDDDKKDEEKTSAINAAGAQWVYEQLVAAGNDAKTAEARLNAALVLGIPEENSKVASAQGFQEHVMIRGLEIAERAGYQVNWEK